MVISINMNIIITYSLAILVTIHCLKFRGIYKTLLLFFGAVIIGGGLENANSIFGGYYYPGSELTLFIGVCPFDVILGWFVLIYCCSFFGHALVGNFRGSLYVMGIGTKPEVIDKQFIRDTILRAALAGLLAINLDFLIDPVAVENEWWIWQIHNIYILGVPLGNYLGWWCLIFWGVVFYDLAISYGSIKGMKELKISALWVVGTILAALFTGLILMASNAWFGMEGVRTEGMNTQSFDGTITAERVEGIIIAIIMVSAAIGAILASSYAPNKLPEPRPAQYLWRVLPSIIMLLFWGLVYIVAILTSPVVAAAGLLFCIPYLIICIYLMYYPYEFPEQPQTIDK